MNANNNQEPVGAPRIKAIIPSTIETGRPATVTVYAEAVGPAAKILVEGPGVMLTQEAQTGDVIQATVYASLDAPTGSRKVSLFTDGRSNSEQSPPVFLWIYPPQGELARPTDRRRLAVYLILAFLLTAYGLIKLWPHPTPSGESRSEAGSLPNPTPGAQTPTTETPMAAEAQAAITAKAPGTTPSQYPRTSPTPTKEEALLERPRPLLLDLCGPKTGLRGWTDRSGKFHPEPSCVSMFGVTFPLWDEQRLLMIVLLSGAIGSLLHALRSFFWYIGNRALVRSWASMYYLLPFIGAGMGFVFYIVFRGGLFSPQAALQDTSPFGFAALSTLVGLFSTQAVGKLKQVAETFFTRLEKGADARPQESAQAAPRSEGPPAKPPEPIDGKPTEQGPVITAVNPEKVPHGQESTITVAGVRLTGTVIRFQETPLTPTGVPTDERLTLTIPADAVRDAGDYVLEIFRPGVSDHFKKTITVE